MNTSMSTEKMGTESATTESTGAEAGATQQVGSVSGPDFIALQVRDVEAAAQFYESRLGLTRAPAAPLPRRSRTDSAA